jgi:hypothetical protein
VSEAGFKKSVNRGKLVLLLIILVSQSGCASLPPAFAYANYVISTITYISTSKGPSDLALSYAVEKDCSMMRALFFKPICKPVTEKTNQPLVAKVKDYINSFNVDNTDAPSEIALTMNTALDKMINNSIQSEVSMNGSGGF